MIKILIYFLFLLIIINFLNKYILQIILQNYLFLIFIIIIIRFPLNNINFWIKIYYLMGVDFYSLALISLRI